MVTTKPRMVTNIQGMVTRSFVFCTHLVYLLHLVCLAICLLASLVTRLPVTRHGSTVNYPLFTSHCLLITVLHWNPRFAGHAHLTESARIGLKPEMGGNVLLCHARNIGPALFFVVPLFPADGTDRTAIRAFAADALGEEQAVILVILVRPF